MKNKLKKHQKNLKIKKKDFKKKNKLEKALIVFMIFLVSITIMSLAFFVFIIIQAPSFSEDKLYSKESSIIYDKENKEFARIGTENRELVTYDDLPEIFIDSLLATEDSRFMQHSGVDMARFAQATLGQLRGNSDAGGASTLTMQIVKQKITDNTATGIKGVIRKFTDVYIAVFKVEKKYTKEQIIEFYVNTPFLSSGAYGIGQASEIFFGKEVHDINLVESALLAGMFQAPSAYNPFNYPDMAKKRRDRVLDLMKRHDYITEEELELAKKVEIEDMLYKRDVISNPYQGMIDTVVEEVKDKTGNDPYLTSMKIYTEFDRDKQKTIDDINNGVTFTWPNEKAQTGIAVTDVETGAIAAIGAGRNKTGELSYNFATMINRHPGSTSKPLFDFAPAIEFLGYGTGQMVIDDVFTYSDGKSIRNWDRGYKGIMTLRNALAYSRNIPSVYLFQKIPQNNLRTFIDNLGLTPEYDKNGFLHESHAIGGYTGANPLQLSAAYATFARGGIYIEPHSFTKIEYVKNNDVYINTPEKRTVMKDSTAYMINMILKTSVTSGFSPAGNVSGTDIASKTGTSTIDAAAKAELGLSSSAIGDAWQIVYSPDYAISIWIGYEEFSKDYHLTNGWGVSTRNKFSRLLSAGILEKNSRFKKPNSVVSSTIELETNPIKLASKYTPNSLKRTEYFRKGTAPSEVSERFSKLQKPSNLTITQSEEEVKLKWDPASTPDFINGEYLSKYFNKGFDRWANKYLNRRLSYNKANIGDFGYQVYLESDAGVKNLGWTNSNTYSYNGEIPSNAKFIVKSAYSIFKDNMSSGISIDANQTTEESGDEIEISLIGKTCLTNSIFNSLLNSNDNFIKVIDDGDDKTSEAIITNTCYDESDNTVNCSSLDPSKEYTVTHRVSYKEEVKSFLREINPQC